MIRAAMPAAAGPRVVVSVAVSHLATPLGTLTAHVDGRGDLLHLDFPGRGADAAATDPRDTAAQSAALARLAAELGEYFLGRRRQFTVPLAPRGTPFQQRVWAELRRIPYGETVSYRQLATRLGNPAACRAVARANATNPIAIVVPCHRVIGSDGNLTGYGGGLEHKRTLLELEGAILPFGLAD